MRVCPDIVYTHVYSIHFDAHHVISHAQLPQALVAGTVSKDENDT